MLILSECNIVLEKSNNYCRLSLVIYGFTGFILGTSALFFPIKLLGICILLYQLFAIFLNPFPAPRFREIAYNAKQWILYEKNGAAHYFEKHRVVLDMGICFLLEFTQEKQRKTMVVFFDQLQPGDYRQLKLIEKIR